MNILSAVRQDKKDYAFILKGLTKKASISEKNLTGTMIDFVATIIGKGEKLSSVNMQLFCNNLENIVLFHNNETLEKLRRKRFLGKKFFDYFIPWTTIQEEIKLINEGGIIYLPYSDAIATILNYLQFKASHHLFEYMEKVGDYLPGDESMFSEKIVEYWDDYERQLRKEKKADTIGVHNTGGRDIKWTKLFKLAAKSNIENIILYHLLKCHYIKKENASNNQIYAAYFDLCRLIIKDREFMSADEYLNKEGKKKKNGKQDEYLSAYEIYKANRVKKVLVYQKEIKKPKKDST